MASRKSAQITNRDAVPAVLNNVNAGYGGELSSAYGRVAAVAADAISDVFRLVEVPTNCRVTSVRLYSAALGGTTAADIGVYRNTRDGGAVVDADLFGSAVSLVSAVNGTEVSHESTVYTPALREQPLWQAAGLSSDPGGTFDIALTLTAAVTTGGNVGVHVDFVK